MLLFQCVYVINGAFKSRLAHQDPAYESMRDLIYFCPQKLLGQRGERIHKREDVMRCRCSDPEHFTHRRER
nr:MAG TPA: hypothetical protein [Caudoviricetes sp.]